MAKVAQQIIARFDSVPSPLCVLTPKWEQGYRSSSEQNTDQGAI